MRYKISLFLCKMTIPYGCKAKCKDNCSTCNLHHLSQKILYRQAIIRFLPRQLNFHVFSFMQHILFHTRVFSDPYSDICKLLAIWKVLVNYNIHVLQNMIFKLSQNCPKMAVVCICVYVYIQIWNTVYRLPTSAEVAKRMKLFL